MKGRAASIQNIATARRAACVMAAVFDQPAPFFFRKTRGAAHESLLRQIWGYLLHTEQLRKDDPHGLSLNSVGAFVGRDRSTIGHAASLIEDFRDEEIDPRVLREALAPLIGLKYEQVEARRLAALLCAVYDIGFSRLLTGRFPDETHARRLLVAMLRHSVLGWRQLEQLAKLSPKYAEIGCREIRALERDPDLARLFAQIRALWARLRTARTEFEALCVSPPDAGRGRDPALWIGQRFDLWLDDLAAILRDVLALGETIDEGVARHMATQKPIPSTPGRTRKAA